MTSDATPQSRRDAWGAIRGFYYQIQVTILRWLDLSEDEHLICESVEDLEILRRDTEGRLSQTIEQVKVREKLTLRSPALVATLARFHESRRTHPKARFRLITTASAGHERDASFHDALPGLEAWNLAHAGRESPEIAVDIARTARAILLAAKRPKRIPSKLWAGFHKDVRSHTPDSFLENYVKRIDWALASGDVASLRSSIQRRLVGAQLVPSMHLAEQAGDQLVAYLFRSLGSRGQKQLRRSDLLTVLTTFSPTHFERDLLQRLEDFERVTTRALQALENKTEHILSSVNAIVPSLTSIVIERTTSAPDVDFALALVDSPPPPPVLLLSRDKLIAHLEELSNTTTVLAVTGQTGIGKTTVAASLYERQIDDSRLWVSLRSKSRVELRRHLSTQLLLRVPLTDARTFDALARDVAKSGIRFAVLDNVPDLNSDRHLADHILALASALRTFGGRLLLTGQAGLPQRVTAPLEPGLREFRLPPLNANEVREFLSSASVDPRYSQAGVLDAILALTSGHPLLVSAFARSVATHTDFSAATAWALLTGEPLQATRRETRKALRGLVADEGSRSLLDRLSFVTGRFDRALMFRLAEVAPAIRSAGERFDELLGVWIEDHGQSQYEVTPLLSGTGGHVLPPATVAAVHSMIAVHYLSEKRITPGRALTVVTHLLAAKEWLTAAGFVLQLTAHIKNQDQAKFFDLILHFFRPFPAEVPVRARIALRAAQVRLAHAAGIPSDELESEFRGLAATATRTGVGAVDAFLGWTLLGPLNPAAPARLAGEGALEGARLFHSLPKDLIKVTLPRPPEALIWAVCDKLHSLKDVEEAYGVFLRMNAEELARAFDDPSLATGVEVIASAAWRVQSNLPVEDRDWERAMSLLENLRQAGKDAGQRRLQEACERSMATIAADQLSDIDGALGLLDLQGCSEEEIERRRNLRGCILIDAHEFERAASEFAAALEMHSPANEHLDSQSARLAAEASAKSGAWSAAASFAQTATELLAKKGFSWEHIDSLAELAWLEFRAGEPVAAAAALTEAIGTLVARWSPDDARFRESARKAGHILGWVRSMVEEGKPPEEAWGGEKYAEPFPGVASRPRPTMAEGEAPLITGALLYMLGSLQTALGLEAGAIASFHATRSCAIADGLDVMAAMAASSLASVNAAAGDFEAAFGLGFEGIRYFALDSNKRHRAFENAHLDQAWSTTAASRRAEIQKLAYWSSLGPFLLASLKAADPRRELITRTVQARNTVAKSGATAIDPPFWLSLLDAADAWTADDASVEELRALAMNPDQAPQSASICYLALITHPNARPSDVCIGQTLTWALCQTWGRLGEGCERIIAEHVYRSWRSIVDSSSALLRSPQLLRQLFAAKAQFSMPRAAAVLRTAQLSTNVRPSPEIVAFLTEIQSRDGR